MTANENYIFTHLGYFKEYYINSRFIGYVICDKDRDLIGYNGKKTETLIENITMTNKKIIKKGAKVTTLLYPLCGKLTEEYQKLINKKYE